MITNEKNYLNKLCISCRALKALKAPPPHHSISRGTNLRNIPSFYNIISTNSLKNDNTSVSKMDRYNDIVVEERTDVVNFSDSRQTKSSEEDFADKLKNIQNKTVRNLSKYSQYSPFQYCANLRSTSAPPTQFSVIVEGEEPVRTICSTF